MRKLFIITFLVFFKLTAFSQAAVYYKPSSPSDADSIPIRYFFPNNNIVRYSYMIDLSLTSKVRAYVDSIFAGAGTGLANYYNKTQVDSIFNAGKFILNQNIVEQNADAYFKSLRLRTLQIIQNSSDGANADLLLQNFNGDGDATLNLQKLDVNTNRAWLRFGNIGSSVHWGLGILKGDNGIDAPLRIGWKNGSAINAPQAQFTFRPDGSLEVLKKGTFGDTVTITTMGAGDNSNRAASTAFVTAAIAAIPSASTDAATLNGQAGSYYLNYNNFTNKPDLSQYQPLLGFTPENVANKATNFTTLNNTLYPTTQAVSNFLGAQGYLNTITGDARYVLQSDGSYVKSVVLNTPNVLYATPINFSTSSNTATGTLTLNSQTANTFFAAPNGVGGTPAFRSIVSADIPDLSATYITGTTNTTITKTGSTLGLNLSNQNTWAATQTFQNILPAADNTYSIGAVSNQYNQIWVGNIRAKTTGNAVTFGRNTAEDFRIAATTGNVLIGTTTDNSKLTVAGSFAPAYRAITAARTVDNTDYTIDCTANTFTVTVPSVTGITGRVYNIINTGSGTITVSGSNNFNGAASVTLLGGHGVQIQAGSTQYVIISQY